MAKLRIGGRAAGYKTEHEPVELGHEEADKLNDQANWHEDVFSDECPWVEPQDTDNDEE